MLRSLVAIFAILIIAMTGCSSGNDAADSGGSDVTSSGDFERADSLDVGDCFQIVMRLGAVVVDCDAPSEYADPEDGHRVLSPIQRVTEVLEHEFDYESTDTMTLCKVDTNGILPGSEIGREDLTFCAERIEKPSSAY